MTHLTFRTVTRPYFDGFMFYVESGSLFDADVYADAYGLNRSDIEAADIHAAQDAAGRLNPGEWLLVEHSVDWEPEDADAWKRADDALITSRRRT